MELEDLYPDEAAEAAWAAQEVEPERSEAWPFQSDGAPEYQVVTRLDTLVRCSRCWAIIEGDVAAQAAHRVWHGVLARDIAAARTALPQRFGSRLPAPIDTIPADSPEPATPEEATA